jgi:phosphoglycolate phosphatase-like HAD superfamily hydrolase
MINVLADDNIFFRNVKAVVWDKDGTILDVNVYWAAVIKRRAFAIKSYLGLEEAKIPILCELMGLDTSSNKLREDGPIAIRPLGDVIKVLLQNLHSWNVSATEGELVSLFNEITEELSKSIEKYSILLPKVKEIMKELYEQDVEQIVFTSDSEVAARKSLDCVGVEQYLSDIIGRERCIESKQSGKDLIRIMREKNWNSENTICIGDAYIDDIMAKKANIQGCLIVATGQIHKKKLEEKVRFVVNDLSEIKIRRTEDER